MSVRQRLERLAPRELRLLRILILCVIGFVLILMPLGTRALLESREEQTDQLRSAIDELIASQPALVKADAARQAVLARYARPAPPLAGFLDAKARESGIEIPESQDRPTVPHGKGYEERAISIQLRKVGLANLSKMLERIERAGYPIVISKLDIRKRLAEPDSYDVELVVSAYDRKDTAKKDGGAPAPKDQATVSSANAAENAEEESE